MNVIDGKDGSATHMAYITLRNMILTGALPAGKKLKIEDLRALLATGASPVREALSLLTSDMLVERIDQRGFRAAPASIANFDEILSLRCTLDDMALRQSITAATSDWEDRLVLSHHRMTRAAAQDPTSFEGAHKLFHMTLLDNASSPMLARFCSQLYDLNIRYRYLAADGPDYKKRDIAAEHESILNAVIRRDADAASAALLNHYRRTGEYLAEKLTNL
jgi:DNA-binding GntR family transcriptional regulator